MKGLAVWPLGSSHVEHVGARRLRVCGSLCRCRTAGSRSRRDPLGFMCDGLRRYGDVFRFQIGPLVFHQLAHPDHVKHVLLDHAKNYPRSWHYDRAGVVVGAGLVTTEGPAWRRLRRMAQPSFHAQRVAGLAGVMTAATDTMRSRWQAYARSGEPLDVAAEFVALTLRIVGRALLGIDLGGEADQIGPAMTTALGYLEHRLANLLSLPLSVPTPRNLRAGVRWQPSTPSSSRSSPAATAHPKGIVRPVTCSPCCWPPGTRRAGRN